MEVKMSSSAKSTIDAKTRAITFHVTLILLLVSSFVVLSGDSPAIAQNSVPAVTVNAPTPISSANDSPSVRDAVAPVSDASVESATSANRDPQTGAPAPQTIVKTFL